MVIGKNCLLRRLNGDLESLQNNAGTKINCDFVVYGVHDVTKNIPEYQVTLDYPGDNREYNINGK